MRRSAVLAALVVALSCLPARADNAALERTLIAQIQARLDAYPIGDTAVWDRDTDPNALLMDEEGRVSTKSEFLAGLKPLPKGSWGQLRVTSPRFMRDGDVAVVAYIADEREMIFQAHLQARFGMVDTYHRVGDRWLLIADTQTRLPLDPPVATLSAAQASKFVGRYHMVDGQYIFDVRMQNGALVGGREGRALHPLLAIKDEPDVFFQENDPARYIFVRDDRGIPVKLVDRHYYNRDMTFTRMQ